MTRGGGKGSSSTVAKVGTVTPQGSDHPCAPAQGQPFSLFFVINTIIISIITVIVSITIIMQACVQVKNFTCRALIPAYRPEVF